MAKRASQGIIKLDHKSIWGISVEVLVMASNEDKVTTAIKAAWHSLFGSLWSGISFFVATISGLTAGLLMLNIVTTDTIVSSRQPIEISLSRAVEEEINDVRAIVIELEKTISLTQNQIRALKTVTTEQKVSVELAAIKKIVEKLRSNYQTIETAIVENPQRAMSLPILRRDIDALGSDLRGDLAATRKEIDRMYDWSKWFVGLMATMALSVLGLAIVNFLKGKE